MLNITISAISAPLPPYVSPMTYNRMVVLYELAVLLFVNVIGVPFTVTKFDADDATLFMYPY